MPVTTKQASRWALTASLACVAACGSADPSSADPASGPVDPATRSTSSSTASSGLVVGDLLFSDEFSGGALDRTKWNSSNWFNPDGCINSSYANGWDDADLLWMPQEYLRLRARRNRGKRRCRSSGEVLDYTAGYIDTKGKFAFRYGYTEIRARAGLKPRSWPAFWLTAQHHWPPEFDVMEFFGRRDGTANVLHAGLLGTGAQTDNSYHWDSTKLNGTHLVNNDSWHTYGLEWGPHYARYYVDGNVVHTSFEHIGDSRFKVPDEPLYLRLNNGVQNQDLPALASSNFDVDYVRVHRLALENPEFEDVLSNGWTCNGSCGRVTDRASGNYAVRLAASASIAQSVRIRPRGVYRLRGRLKAAQGGRVELRLRDGAGSTSYIAHSGNAYKIVDLELRTGNTTSLEISCAAVGAVGKCDALLLRAEEPAPPARFLEVAGIWLSGFSPPEWAAVADVNGDGKDDIVWYEAKKGGAVTVALSNGQGFDNAGQWLHGWGTPDWAALGDLDGDGRADLAWYEAWNGGSITVALSTGRTFGNISKWQTGWGQPDWAALGDLDGDGRADLAWYEKWKNGSLTVALSTGQHFGEATAWLSGWDIPDWAALGDVNGDGLADLAWYEQRQAGTVKTAFSGGRRFANVATWSSGWGRSEWAGLGDFDGDGRADIAWYESWNDSSITVAPSQGDQVGVSKKWLSGWGGPDWASVGDFDGDGRADVAWYEIWKSKSISVAVAR